MNSKFLKVISIFLVIIFVALASFLIYLGVKFNKEASPLVITNALLDKVYKEVSTFFKTDSLFVDNNFTYTKNLQINSSTINENVKLTANYQLLKEITSKITPYNLDMSLIQDRDNKKLFLQTKEILSNMTLNTKLLLENATKYYYVDAYTPTYVNNGTNNYFEALSKKITLKDNLTYLENFIFTSFKNNLKEEYFSEYDDNIYVNNQEEKVKRITLKITDKFLKEMTNNILSDLKNDSRACSIMEGYDKDFKKRKYNFTFDYTANISLNIYVDRWFNKIRKVEIVNLVENDESKISFEKDGSKEVIYIISNAKVDEYIEINNGKMTIYNANEKNIGSIDLEKEKDDKLINFYLNDENNHLEIFYEDKYKENENNYENQQKFNIKLAVKKIDIIDLAITSTSIYQKEAVIDEIVDETILENSLDKSVKEELFNNKESKFLQLIRR